MIEKLTKDQIINQALQFSIQGNISEAVKLYQFCINQGYNDHRVFSNFGLILKNHGKLNEAAILVRKAVELKPNNINAHNNLGIILRGLGKLSEAEISMRKAIELKPDLAEAHYNLGTILKDSGKLHDAEISTRKAIELKDDLIEAYYNLGTILSDLGKIEEVILLLKSTLKLNSITQGDKLIATLQLTIANLLQGDFSGTLLNLNKTNELINQGAFNTIKNEKTKKHSLIFSRFISSLYPQLKKDKQNCDSKKILHIGESHCLSFAHQTLTISSKEKQIQPVLITGAKAWHFANNKNNHWKDSLFQQMKSKTLSDEIFISFGEIDCRKDQGILSYTIKKNRKISEVCERTIKGYLNHIENTISNKFLKKYYFGIPAPTMKKGLQDELDIKRIETIKIYNLILKKEVLSRGSYFFDVYDLTSNKNGENNNLHMCDSVHLSPLCLPILFENHLHKP